MLESIVSGSCFTTMLLPKFRSFAIGVRLSAAMASMKENDAGVEKSG